MKDLKYTAHLLKIGYTLQEALEQEQHSLMQANEEGLEYPVIEKRTASEYHGAHPYDYSYFGEVEIQMNGKPLYVQGAYYPNGETIFGVAKKSIFLNEDDQITREDVLEQWRTLDHAYTGSFGSYFQIVEQITDEKAYETMLKVNDTRHYNVRLGLKKNENLGYIEAFNQSQPDLSEYLFVSKKDGEYHYIASHHSVFMQYELGDIYAKVYGVTNSDIYLDVTSIEEIPEEYHYFVSSFRQMKRNLNEFLYRHGMKVTLEELQEGVRASRVISLRILETSDALRRHVGELLIETEDEQTLYVTVYDSEELLPCWAISRESIYDGIVNGNEISALSSIIESTDDWNESKQSSFSDYFKKIEEIAKSTFHAGKKQVVWNEREEDYFNLSSLLK